MIAAAVLTLIGLGFVLAEVFFPSLGLFGLIAGGLILAADLAAFGEGQTTGWIFVVIQVVAIPTVIWLGFKALPHLSFGRRMLLTGPVTQPTPGLPDLEALEGKAGVALTDLRPGGMARIENERVSVVAIGGVVEQGTNIVVVAVDGPEVRVRADDGAPAP